MNLLGRSRAECHKSSVDYVPHLLPESLSRHSMICPPQKVDLILIDVDAL